MPGCGESMTTYIPRGFGYREIEVSCGSTSPDGNPFLCPKCEEEYKDVNWRRLAEENGEQWDDDY